jgi:ribonuclease PH
VLIECGRTKVLCTVTFTDQVPQWMRPASGAWLTAEYSMLPGSTEQRKPRDGRTQRADGRSLEIQRLIGRALRSVVDMSLLPEGSVWVDCDVLSADGGTRTAAINGACVALYDAFLYLEEKKLVRKWPMRSLVSAVSVGLCQGKPLVDLDYAEDSVIDVDLNLVCLEDGRFVEVQGSAERAAFDDEQFRAMTAVGRTACAEIIDQQRRVLGLHPRA